MIKHGYDVQAGQNKVMANDAEKFADNREKSNNKRFDEKD